MSRPLLLAGLLCAAASGCGEPPPAVLEGEPRGPYRLTLTLPRTAPAPAQETLLELTLTRTATGEPVRDLARVHERLVHSFIVARDFSSFAHIHHEDFAPRTVADEAAGRFRFPYRFPKAGGYRLVSEYVHRDRAWRQQFEFTIGDVADAAPPAPAQTTTAHSGRYVATLATSPAPPVAGHEAELVVTLARDGEPVTDLALHLGAEVHAALWRTDGAHFGHTHSYTPAMAALMETMRGHAAGGHDAGQMLAEMASLPSELVYPGPRVPVRHTFPAEGVYHVFMELAPRGEPHVFHFVVEVRDEGEHPAAALHSIVSPTAP